MTIKRRRRRAAAPKAALLAQPVELASVIETVAEPSERSKEIDRLLMDDPEPAAPFSDEMRAQGREPSDDPEIMTPVSAPRRRRASVGGHSLKLSAPSREGEKRRWVNDDGNNIADKRELGYEFVSETGIKTADPGSRVSRLVGTKANGEPLHAYLMETPEELYAQGVDEKEAANRKIDEAITSGRDSTGRLENQYGQGSITTDR